MKKLTIIICLFTLTNLYPAKNPFVIQEPIKANILSLICGYYDNRITKLENDIKKLSGVSSSISATAHTHQALEILFSPVNNLNNMELQSIGQELDIEKYSRIAGHPLLYRTFPFDFISYWEQGAKMGMGTAEPQFTIDINTGTFRVQNNSVSSMTYSGGMLDLQNQPSAGGAYTSLKINDGAAFNMLDRDNNYLFKAYVESGNGELHLENSGVNASVDFNIYPTGLGKTIGASASTSRFDGYFRTMNVNGQTYMGQPYDTIITNPVLTVANKWSVGTTLRLEWYKDTPETDYADLYFTQQYLSIYDKLFLYKDKRMVLASGTSSYFYGDVYVSSPIITTSTVDGYDVSAEFYALKIATGTLDTAKLDKSSATATYVFKSGDTMTGDLIVNTTIQADRLNLYSASENILTGRLYGTSGGGDTVNIFEGDEFVFRDLTGITNILSYSTSGFNPYTIINMGGRNIINGGTIGSDFFELNYPTSFLQFYDLTRMTSTTTFLGATQKATDSDKLDGEDWASNSSISGQKTFSATTVFSSATFSGTVAIGDIGTGEGILEIKGNTVPRSSKLYNLGGTGRQWSNTYTDNIYFSSGTATGEITSNYGFFHERDTAQNPMGYDFNVSSFSATDSWRDLSLASIVPTGTKTVLLRVIVINSVGGIVMKFCKDSGVSVYNKGQIYSVAGNYNSADIIVSVDSNRGIDYFLENYGTWSLINVTVAGWWK